MRVRWDSTQALYSHAELSFPGRQKEDQVPGLNQYLPGGPPPLPAPSLDSQQPLSILGYHADSPLQHHLARPGYPPPPPPPPWYCEVPVCGVHCAGELECALAIALIEVDVWSFLGHQRLLWR